MKNKILLCLLMISPLFAFPQFELQGNASSDFNGKMIYLYSRDNDVRIKPVLRDSMIIRKGRFNFSGQMLQPVERMLLEIRNGKKVYRNGIDAEPGISKLLVIPTIGSQYFELKVPVTKTSVLLDKINAVRSKAFSDFRGDDFYKREIILPAKERREMEIKVLEILKAHPSHYLSMQVLYELRLYEMFQDDEELLLDVFAGFDEELKSSPLGKEFKDGVQSELNARLDVKIGKPVPAFSVNTLEGTKFNNSDLAGSPYIIAFSAAWSVKGNKFQSHLQKIYQQYKEQGLKVVYFNLDDNAIRWQGMVQRYKLDWINVSEGKIFRESKIARQFNVSTLPKFLVVNQQGQIVFNSDSSEEYETGLEEIVALLMK